MQANSTNSTFVLVAVILQPVSFKPCLNQIKRAHVRY